MLSTVACRVRRRQRGQELGARSSGLGHGLMCLSCYDERGRFRARGAWRPPEVGALAGTEAIGALEATVRELVGS
jgi:hypothetical protein